MNDWILADKTTNYHYWQRNEDDKIVYNCTKDNKPPQTEGGYYNLGSLKQLKNEVWHESFHRGQ